jgi:hypothetical protein
MTRSVGSRANQHAADPKNSIVVCILACKYLTDDMQPNATTTASHSTSMHT